MGQSSGQEIAGEIAYKGRSAGIACLSGEGRQNRLTTRRDEGAPDALSKENRTIFTWVAAERSSLVLTRS